MNLKEFSRIPVRRFSYKEEPFVIYIIRNGFVEEPKWIIVTDTPHDCGAEWMSTTQVKEQFNIDL